MDSAENAADVEDPVQKALDPLQWQISYSGKDDLKAAMDSFLPDQEKLVEFIKKFAALRRINLPAAQPMMDLFDLGGVTPNKRARLILVAMRESMKRQIVSLDQEQLEVLLHKCYPYLTIPELSAIPIAALERMTYVDPGTWTQIVDNGVEESPYVHLPISIKRRIWVSEVSAFNHEIDLILSKLPELPPLKLHAMAEQKMRKLPHAPSPMLNELMRMTQGLSEELIALAVDKMVDTAAECETPKRMAIANLFHDFLVRVTTRSDSNMETLRRMAIVLNSVDSAEIDPSILHEMREALSVASSCGPVALLVGSTHSRDYLADQLITYLLNRRGPIESFDDASLLATAAEHIKNDPAIPNLTYLCMANMRAHSLLQRAGFLSQAEVERPFEMFYPLMIHEMWMDVEQFTDSYFQHNATVPNEALEDFVQKGRLERRVLTSYCLTLYTLEIPVGLARFRLFLDSVCRSCDATEEPRELMLAAELIHRIVGT